MGELPDTVMDRSVVIPMRRRRADEPTAGDMHFVLDVRMLALLWSIAMALMSWVGFRYWHARSPIVAWLLLLAIVGHTVVIALNGISIGV